MTSQSTDLPVSQSTNPYVGPRTFTTADRARFFGREPEAAALLARVVSERLLLFYAQSGAGKSSLLNARLIPQLREEEGFGVLPVGRVAGALPAGVAQVDNIFLFNLKASLDQSGSGSTAWLQQSLSDFLEHLVTDDGLAWRYDPAAAAEPAAAEPAVAEPAADEAGAAVDAGPAPRFALIIDQFEEIITGHPDRWREREGFFRQLDAALQANPNLWVVLTLREDYVASLDPYAPLVFNRLRARFYMERMGVAAGLDAIRKPAALGGRPFAPGVAEQLVDNLRQVRVPGQEATVPGQYVEPVQLQVVCYQLWQGLTEADEGRTTTDDRRRTTGDDGRLITAEDLARAGDVDRALTQFYEETLAAALADPAAAGVNERQLRTWFDEELITEAGTRGLVHQGERETGSLPTGVVRALQRRFLVRGEARGGDTWIELVHDRFVEPIRRSNTLWFRTYNHDPVSQGAAAWEQAGKPFAKELLPFASKDTESAKGCTGAGGVLLGFMLIHPKRALSFLVGIAGVEWLGDSDLQAAEVALLQGNSGYTKIEQEYIMASRGQRFWRQIYRKIAWAWVIPLALIIWWCGIVARLPTIPTVREKNVEIVALQLQSNAVEMAYATHLAEEGEIDRALQMYKQAIKQRVDLLEEFSVTGQEVSSTEASNICRLGALWERVERVILFCDFAVDAAKDYEQRALARDSRGLARSLTGDVAGAIEDFEFAVNWAQETGYEAPFIESRTAWIAALRAGKNPFDAATLERLRNE